MTFVHIAAKQYSKSITNPPKIITPFYPLVLHVN
jgi:hypothetical protein